jgi:hypothetical protein
VGLAILKLDRLNVNKELSMDSSVWRLEIYLPELLLKLSVSAQLLNPVILSTTFAIYLYAFFSFFYGKIPSMSLA